MHTRNFCILVSGRQQTLTLCEGDRVVFEALVSTSRHGFGSEAGSFCTPTGNFSIGEKIGEDAPRGAVFKGRRWTGAVADKSSKEDQICTRILWLDGMDAENANTRSRYIYIHGTNHPESIGTPASIGCVRMLDDDLITLFDIVEVGDPLVIAE